MKKISIDAAEKFFARKDFKRRHTEVIRYIDGHAELELHGNVIAKLTDDDLILSDCGWNTVTTRDRLNAILAHEDCMSMCFMRTQVVQRNGYPYFECWNHKISKKDRLLPFERTNSYKKVLFRFNKIATNKERE